MKFVHTSDLHIGKIVNGFSMLEDQKFVLSQVVKIAKRERADAVFLSGDLYDRSVAPAQAVKVLDDFLTELIEQGARVFAVAGNHDCGERIGFASRILGHSGLYMAGEPKAIPEFADVEDQYGAVRIHLLPFAKPVEVRWLYGKEVADFDESVREQLNHVKLLKGGRNILLAHHFVVNQSKEPETCDSDSRVTVGGADQVEAANFKDFDYVALGHLHGRQKIGERQVWYSGSPLKYSFSETYHEKGLLVGEMDGQGGLKLRSEPLTPLHDTRVIRGRLSDLIRDDVAMAENPEDYILAVLTNEEELLDPIGVLRSVYPNIMQLKFSRKAESAQDLKQYAAQLKEKTPFQLFEDFFDKVMGKELSKEQQEIVRAVVEQAKEVER